jgi:hypothetical protein
MAVVYVQELFEGRTGSDNLERRRSYVRMFEVRTDDPADDATVAGGTPLLPRNGEPFPNDEFAVMVAIDPAQSSADNTLWYVTCRYSSDLPAEQQREALNYDSSGIPYQNPGSTASAGGGGGGQVSREDDPRDRPAQFEVDWEQASEIVYADINGDAITNSAGDPFDPPPMMERNYPVITITKNVALDNAILDIEKQQEYQEVTNSDTPWGRDEKTLRMVRFKHSSAIENDLAYAVVSLSIKVKWDTWTLLLADIGYRDINGDTIGGDPATGAPPSEPKPLDGAGLALPVGDPMEFRDYEIYRPIPFIPILALLGVTA